MTHIKEKTNYRLWKQIRMTGRTQGQLVREAGIQSETRLTRIIRGYAPPTQDEVNKICSALNAQPDDLGFGDQNE